MSELNVCNKTSNGAVAIRVELVYSYVAIDDTLQSSSYLNVYGHH